MFGIGTPELLLILAVALIVIGPKKLPDLAKSLGKAMGEFKRATSDLKQSIEQDTTISEVRDSIREAKQDLLKPPPSTEPNSARLVTDSNVSASTTDSNDDDTNTPANSSTDQDKTPV